MTDELDTPSASQSSKRQGRPVGKKDSAQARSDRRKRKALNLIAKGVEVDVIAKSTGLHPNSISNYKQEYLDVFQDLDDLPSLRKNKVDLIEAGMFTLLKQLLSKEKLEKASVNNCAYAFTQLHQALRLETNKSTSNTSQQVSFASIKLPDDS